MSKINIWNSKRLIYEWPLQITLSVHTFIRYICSWSNSFYLIPVSNCNFLSLSSIASELVWTAADLMEAAAFSPLLLLSVASLGAALLRCRLALKPNFFFGMSSACPPTYAILLQ